MNIGELKFLKIKTEIHPSTGSTLEYLKHYNAICSLLLNFEETKALLVYQYRPGKGSEMYEIPAGLIDEGEIEDDAMFREIREETGYKKEDIEVLYKSPKPYLISPGYTTEKLYFYITKLKSRDIKNYEQKLDEGEDILCKWISLDKMEEVSEDIKTILALNLYKQKIR